MTMRAKRYQNSAALQIFMRRTTIPNSTFKQSFHPQSRDAPFQGLTLPHDHFPKYFSDLSVSMIRFLLVSSITFVMR